MLASAETPLFAAEEAKKALIGLARDLRGLAFAFNTKTSYMMLFDWMYPFKQFSQLCFVVRLI
jgi:exportin-7